MGSFGFSLADRLGAKPMPCSVPGCTRTWLRMAGQAAKLTGRAAPDPNDPTSSMCDPCRDKRTGLTDATRPCDRPGCAGTWTFSIAEQMESFVRRQPPSARLCADCEARLANLQDKDIPCSVSGCARTGVFTKRAQLLAGAPEVEAPPPGAMCPPCAQVSTKLKDRPITCGINGCRGKWVWTLDEQLQAFAAGKNNEPPRRMCAECQGSFGGLADREIRCRTSGCKKTWTWARGDQLDACLPGRPPPKAPTRMCQSCLDIFSSLKDVERPCRRASCKRTWTDKRGAQLARAVRGKTGDPYPHYCIECEKEIGDLEDRSIPCKTDNCEGTWIWAKAQQLAAGVRPAGAGPDKDDLPSSVQGGGGPRPGTRKQRRDPRPPERRCEACSEFLAAKKTKEISCTRCATPIYWPPESQLQTHLGNWAEPSLCGACKRDVTEAARAAEREALRHPAPAPPPETLSSATVMPDASGLSPPRD